MKGQMLKCVLVLGAICLAVAVLLAAVNYVTAPIIEENARKEQEKAYLAVLPDATDFEAVELTAEVPKTVSEIRRDKGGSGYAFTVNAAGYGGSSSPITAIVGIDASGRITKIVVTDISGESAGIGDKVGEKNYLESFVGKDALLDGISTISGATISSSGFISGVKDAFTAFLAVAEFEETDEQKLARLVYEVLDGMTEEIGYYPLPISDTSVVSALRANLPKGYAVAVKSGDETLIVGLNPFGEIVGAIDLSENDRTADLPETVITNAKAAIADDLAAIRARHAEDISVMLGEGTTLTALGAVDGLPASVIDAYRVSGDGDAHYALVLHVQDQRIAVTATADGAVIEAAVLSPVGGTLGETDVSAVVQSAINLYRGVSGQ